MFLTSYNKLSTFCRPGRKLSKNKNVKAHLAEDEKEGELSMISPLSFDIYFPYGEISNTMKLPGDSFYHKSYMPKQHDVL